MTPTAMTPTTRSIRRRPAHRAIRSSLLTATLITTAVLGAHGVPPAGASPAHGRLPVAVTCSPLAGIVGSATGLATGTAACLTQDPMAHTTPDGVLGFVSSHVRLTG